MMSRISKYTMGVMLSVLTLSATAALPPLLEFELDNSMTAIQRGAVLVQGNCLMCHDIKYVKYRDLEKTGIAGDELAVMRGDHEPGNAIMSMMTEDARQEMFGILPPDLSLMVLARRGGGRYIYSFLLGFAQTAEGDSTNIYYPETVMPDPLGISYMTDENGRQTIRQQAADIVAFLAWAADPHAAERKQLGYYVVTYMVLLTLLLYIIKRRVWSRLDAQE